MMFSLGTNPQKRLSDELSRLSPIAKYALAGTITSPAITFLSAGSVLRHFVDLGEHFFTQTRWERTLRIVRGFPDSELPAEALPVNPGLPKP